MSWSKKQYSTNKELDRLAREAIGRGWVITHTNGGHLKWMFPGSASVLFTAVTTRSTRGVRNAASQMRRIEAEAKAKERKPVKA